MKSKMPTKATWDDLVAVVRGISHREDGPPVKGDFTIVDNALLDALKACIASESDTNIYLPNDEEIDKLTIGETVKIEISPRLGFGLVTKNVGTLLFSQYARTKEPKNFLLTDDFIATNDTVPDGHLLSTYRATLSFIQALKKCAAFLDPDEPALVFIKEGKFEVPIEYDEDTLKKLDLKNVQEIAAILQDGTHGKQCSSILADTIISLTATIPSNDRFKYLLINASALKKQFDQGYQLYAAGFSYEKIHNEIEAARVEYLGKIHKIFSDIQNQLLGIPVATIIVATQMKENNQVDGSFWVNLAVLLGSFVFMLLMLFLIRNQRHTLDVIGIEIKRQRSKLEKEYAAVAPNLLETFTSLDNRYRAQITILCTIDAVVVGGFLLATFFFYKLSMPVQQWLEHLLHEFCFYL